MDREQIQAFFIALDKRSPSDLEREAIECLPDLPKREHLWHAAAQRFAPRACRELVQLWSKRTETYAADIAQYWREIAEWLPIEGQPAPGSAINLFYRACKMEYEGRKRQEALELYLQASIDHPLAAASAGRIGGVGRKLEGWKRYTGRKSRAIVALQCLSVFEECCSIHRPEDEFKPDDTWKPLPQYLHGMQACHMSVELGCAEAALFYRELYQSGKTTAGFLILAARESLAASFRYKSAREFYMSGHSSDLAYWASREPCKLADKICRADVPAVNALLPPTCVLFPHVSVPDEPRLVWLSRLCQCQDWARVCVQFDPPTISLAAMRLAPTASNNTGKLPLHPPNSTDPITALYENAPRSAATPYANVSYSTQSSYSNPDQADHYLNVWEPDSAPVMPSPAAAGAISSNFPISLSFETMLAGLRRIDSTAFPLPLVASGHWTAPHGGFLVAAELPGEYKCGHWEWSSEKKRWVMWARLPHPDATSLQLHCEACHAAAKQPILPRCLPPRVAEEAREKIADEYGRKLWSELCVLAPRSELPIFQQVDKSAVCNACMWSSLCVSAKSELDISSAQRILVLLYHTAVERRVLRYAGYLDQCLHLLCGPTINADQWADLCAWFGPADSRAMFLRMGWLLTQQWFYGRITSAEAVKIISPHAGSIGSWLFRFSMSERGGFAFTVAEKNGTVTHYRVSREWDDRRKKYGGYVLRMKPQDRRYATLSSLLAGARGDLDLREPVATVNKFNERVCASELIQRTFFLGRVCNPLKDMD